MKKILLAAFALICSTQLFGIYYEIDSQSDFKNKKEINAKSIVSFYSPECPHCKVFMPAFKEIAKKNNNVVLMGINVDDAQLRGLARSYRVTKTPTVYVIDKQNNTRRKITGSGNAVRSEIKQMLKE